jgi:hypothetical protein
MDITILANFIKRCFELGVPSDDCGELLKVLETDIALHVAALRLWMDEALHE